MFAEQLLVPAAAATTTAPAGAALALHHLIVETAKRGKAGDQPSHIAAGAGTAGDAVRGVEAPHKRVELGVAVLATVFVNGHGTGVLRTRLSDPVYAMVIKALLYRSAGGRRAVYPNGR